MSDPKSEDMRKANAWREAYEKEIGAPEAYDELIFAAHKFAHATGAPAGVNVLDWAQERANAAMRAGWAAITPADPEQVMA